MHQRWLCEVQGPVRNTPSLNQAGRVLSRSPGQCHQPTAYCCMKDLLARELSRQPHRLSLSSPPLLKMTRVLGGQCIFPSPGHLVQENVRAATRVQASWKELSQHRAWLPILPGAFRASSHSLGATCLRRASDPSTGRVLPAQSCDVAPPTFLQKCNRLTTQTLNERRGSCGDTLLF